MTGDSLMSGFIGLERLTSDASWQRMIRRAKQVKSELEVSECHSHKLDKEKRKSLREACQKFEAIFVGYLLKEMRKTVQHSPLFPETMAEKIYKSMLDDEVAQAACKGGGIGLGDMVFNELINVWEVQSERGEEESESEMGEESAKVSGLTCR